MVGMRIRSRLIAAAAGAGLLAAAGCGEPEPLENAATPAPDGGLAAPPPQVGAGSGRAEEVEVEADATEAVADEEILANAVLEPTEGYTAYGTVGFAPQPDGQIMIVVNIAGLKPGQHGIHIHENGDCSAPDASSAGEHFSPAGDPHGSPLDAAAQHHAGDLGNVNADDAGAAETRIFDEELSLEGEFGVVGRAVVVHAERDDLESQPDGESGDRVACGVIEAIEPGAR